MNVQRRNATNRPSHETLTGVTVAVWFDGDETLWDRRGFMLSGLESELNGGRGGDLRKAEVFADVAPSLLTLIEHYSINLIEYSELPEGAGELLPPFENIVRGPATPADIEPSLHTVESRLNWIDTLETIEGLTSDGSDVILVSDTLAGFELAADRGWMTVWLNRDRMANLSDVLPHVEIHTLLDLPDAIETMQDAVAAAAQAPVTPA